MSTGRNKKTDESSQRRYPRMKPHEVPGLKSVELSQGTEVDIVNISRGGLLLETEARLRPDMTIMLKVVTTEGILRLDGTILRSSIYSLEGAPRYRTAIAFKQPLELVDESVISTGEIPGGEDCPLQHLDAELGGLVCNEEKAPAILTVVAQDNNGICLEKKFSMNDW